MRSYFIRRYECIQRVAISKTNCKALITSGSFPATVCFIGKKAATKAYLEKIFFVYQYFNNFQMKFKPLQRPCSTPALMYLTPLGVKAIINVPADYKQHR
jgi:hypothetical protein